MAEAPPFGKPFKYTDPSELETQLDRAKPWYKRWFSRRPKAWQVIGEDLPNLPVVFLTWDGGGEPPLSSEIIAPGVSPIYDLKRAILDADEYERANPSVAGSG